MHRRLQAHASARSDPVRIRVSAEQNGLEKEQAIGPNRGSAAKPGQHEAPHHRLDLEQQERTEEDGGGNQDRLQESRLGSSLAERPDSGPEGNAPIGCTVNRRQNSFAHVFMPLPAWHGNCSGLFVLRSLEEA